MKFKISILKVHLAVVCILFLDFILHVVSGYSLDYYIKTILKVLLALSGVLLIFLYKKKHFLFYCYSLVYVLISMLIILNYLFFKRLDFFNIVNERNYNKNELVLYRQFPYYKLECCYFLVYKKEYFLLEKKLGYINIDEKISNDTHELKLEGNKIAVKSAGTYYNESKDLIQNADFIMLYEITQSPF